MDINWSMLERVVFSWKYLAILLFAAAGWFLLSRNRAFRRRRLWFQGLAFLLLGGLLGLFVPWAARAFALHPSPVCAVTKGTAFAVFQGGLAVPMAALVAVAVVFTLVGAKAFCGWACPLGAVQELVYNIPGIRKLRLPFRWTNGVRVAVFLAFLAVLLGWKLIIYDYFNPFESLHWTGLGRVLVWGPIAVFVLASLWFFRPFCATLCPLGLVSWLFERASLGRVRVGPDCNQCGTCLETVHCQALPALIERARVTPDCHGCGNCQGQCAMDAIRFSWKLGRSAAEPEVDSTSREAR
jgi:polyferredoxin